VKSELEDKLLKKMADNGLPVPERDYRFHPKRKWLFDFAWPRIKVAVEVDGGTWSRGRHTRGGGYAKDVEKFNCATIMGWRVLHFTAEQIEDTYAIKTIWRVMGGPTYVGIRYA